MCSWETDIASFAGIHAVTDANSANIPITFAMEVIVDTPGHSAWWLVSDHFSKDSETDGTSHPIFFSFEVIEATFVEQMCAGKCDDVLI